MILRSSIRGKADGSLPDDISDREAHLPDTAQLALAEQAAKMLFDSDDPGAADIYEPRNAREADAAVRRLGRCFEELPGSISRVLEAASGSGTLLSGDRLQGISEMVQNADDVGASQVRLALIRSHLLMTHDGTPVRLPHVLGIATPWLSTKSEESDTIGRFGIGLMALRSLSETMEIHCAPYHVRIGAPAMSPIDPPRLPEGFQNPGWTTIRIPLAEGTLTTHDLAEWLDRWGDAALLFLRHVSGVTLLGREGETVRQLSLRRSQHEEMAVGETSEIETISRHHASASNGRSWVVISAGARSPRGLSRAHKATGRITPVSVALPLDPAQSGTIYAGLPVEAASPSLFVSAQFDPLTSRLGFADNAWNRALVPLAAEVWSHAALDLFRRDPKQAWAAMPVPAATAEGAGGSVVRLLAEEVLGRARRWLSSRLSFDMPGEGQLRLSELAVEEPALEHIITEAETAALAELPAALPSAARDDAGAWRSVLDDWRSAGAPLPEPVSVERALDLMMGEARPEGATIALAAAALAHDLGECLSELPCVIASDGRRLIPPAADSPYAVAASASPLAEELGLATLLHSAHLSDREEAAAVLTWLEESGSLLDGDCDAPVVLRLAAAGRSGREIADPLTDGQVQALRDAFELMDPADRLEIGSDVGRAVSLEAFTYDGSGRTVMTVARPAEAYLPRSIDREPDSFAAVAAKTPGITWISGRYAEVLRSPAGRQGVGAQKFLSLLGAARAPRLRPHPLLEQRYIEMPKGLKKWVQGGPEGRWREMQKRGATYTLGDCDSPDLSAVARNISHERRKRSRRIRAAALLAALGRAWDRHLNDFAEVESARDYYQWDRKGQIRAFWLWEAGDIAWLDDESGTPRRPVDLRIRTPGNVAVYGAGSGDYLHRDLSRPHRKAVLRAIGAPGDPSRSELIDRLRTLRDGPQEEDLSLQPSDLHRETAIIYKALAHGLGEATSASDLTSGQLRSAFQQGQGLLLTDHGWLPPRSVLAGPSIFGRHMAFAPQVEGAEPLWSALNLREPSPENCLRVIHRIARGREEPDGEDETVLLETLRALAHHHGRGNSLPPRRLSGLALWTSKGWVRERPVYATDDPILARGLREELPLWEPGGDLEQFQSLLGPLRVVVIRPGDAEVIDPDLAEQDPEATEMFRRAIGLLREDLVRNDHRLAEGMRVPWEDVLDFDVRIHPSLSLRVHAEPGGRGQRIVSGVDAEAYIALGTMFVSRVEVLPRVDGGGRALAALFEGNARHLAQAWRAACDRAEEGIRASNLEPARQRDDRSRAATEEAISARTASFSMATDASSRGRKGSVSGKSAMGRPDIGPKASQLGPRRLLVDPDSLEVVDPKGRIDRASAGERRERGSGRGLVEPSKTAAPVRNRSALPGYSAKDREDVGMELVRKLLSSDEKEIVDLRSQRGVGADAVDSLRGFYELKVMAGAEPDQVTLTSSEVQRAMTEDKFFLIVVSGVEGIDARPRVRVFVDPLNQLSRTYSGSITLSGIHTTKSLLYEFAPMDGEDVPLGTGND